MIRVMKARRSSVLACGCRVTTGKLIVKPDGGPWVCMACHLAATGRRQDPA